MRGFSKNNCRIAATIALSMLAAAPGAAYSATVQDGVSLPGIPQAGDPSFTFDISTQDGGYASTIMSWYTNYLYIAPSDTGYDVYAYNAGDFEFEQTSGEVYAGSNGSMALNAQLDQNGDVISGQYLLTGEIAGLGIDEISTLTSGDIVDMETEGATVGFATDNISCAIQIQNCLEAESIYVFTDMEVPELSELNGTAGFMATTASVTTVPLPGAAWLFLSGLVIIARKART